MSKRRNFAKEFSLVSHIGFMMVVPIVGCIMLGAFLDNHFNTNAIFVIVFTILGVLSAFRNLYVISMSGIKRAERNRSNEED